MSDINMCRNSKWVKMRINNLDHRSWGSKFWDDTSNWVNEALSWATYCTNLLMVGKECPYQRRLQWAKRLYQSGHCPACQVRRVGECHRGWVEGESADGSSSNCLVSPEVVAQQINFVCILSILIVWFHILDLQPMLRYMECKRAAGARSPVYLIFLAIPHSKVHDFLAAFRGLVESSKDFRTLRLWSHVISWRINPLGNWLVAILTRLYMG